MTSKIETEFRHIKRMLEGYDNYLASSGNGGDWEMSAFMQNIFKNVETLEQLLKQENSERARYDRNDALLLRDAERYRLLRLYKISAVFGTEAEYWQRPHGAPEEFSDYSDNNLDTVLDKMLCFKPTMKCHTPEILKAMQDEVADHIRDLSKNRFYSLDDE